MNSCCVHVGIKSSHSDLLFFIFTWDGGGCLLSGFKNASHTCWGVLFVVLGGLFWWFFCFVWVFFCFLFVFFFPK